MMHNERYVKTQVQGSPQRKRKIINPKTTNPSKLERTKYAGYMDCEGDIPDSGFFNLDGMLRQRMKRHADGSQTAAPQTSRSKATSTSSVLLENTKYAEYLADFAACEDSGFFNFKGQFKAAKTR